MEIETIAEEDRMTHNEIADVFKRLELNRNRYNWLIKQLGWYYGTSVDQAMQADGWQPGVKIPYDVNIHGEDWYNFELKSEYCWFHNDKMKTEDEFRETLRRIVNENR